MSHPLTTLALLLVALLGSATARAEARLFCVYDPAGKAGDFYAILSDYAVEASAWGVEVELRAYTDEETAAKDYEAGHCDGVVATGVRLQRFNRFPSTIEAMGAIEDYDLLESMIRTLATYESAAAKLRSGDHETVGFLPAGTVYLFLRDREVDTVSELAGIRVATMDYDKATPVMVDRVGAIAVPADLGSIGPKFNNGAVDACYMSAPGYGPFELWRGLDEGGGVLDYPLGQATLQVMIRHTRFPADFGARSRADLLGRVDQAVVNAKRADAEIPDKYWIRVPDSTRAEWDDMFREVRIRLRDEEGAYDGQMLSALRKLRCARDASRAECVEKKE